MKFWDTSAIVPLCVQEPNSGTVREILIEDPSMVVWWGTRTECISALVRQVREGGLTPTDERTARHVLQTLMQTWTEMQPSETLCNETLRASRCSNRIFSVSSRVSVEFSMALEL